MTIPLRYAIVIPVYNHGTQVRGVVEKCLQLRLPVIVVDDGSTDSTPHVLASISGITVIRHKKNQGKGAALLTGFVAAFRIADWAITIDADGQHDTEDILPLIQAVPVTQRPIVIGKRTGMEHGNVPWSSRWGRRFANFWVWASCGRWFSDSQSGFRLYPLPETPNLGTKTKRYQFEVEVLVRAVWRGIPVLEAPVRTLYGPLDERVSYFRPWRDFWRNTRTFARLIAMRVLIPSRLRK
ncbi:MAG: glycosyltransferase family 2 protein [Deltaproteobacteria bacterium]|nr:glycosyltransferase family 2 protein [Deltaproteobacteria bacterium]